jgi:hypothetical protein
MVPQNIDNDGYNVAGHVVWTSLSSRQWIGQVAIRLLMNRGVGEM